MKKGIFTFCCVILFSASFAQKFQLAELIKLIPMSSDDFDTYVTRKGYHFKENHKEDLSNGITYSFDGKICMEQYILTKYNFLNGEVSITYHTIDKEDYLTIKKQLKSLGFQLKEEKNEDDSVWFIYKNKSMTLALISSEAYTTTAQSLSRGSYEISLSKYPSQK